MVQLSWPHFSYDQFGGLGLPILPAVFCGRIFLPGGLAGQVGDARSSTTNIFFFLMRSETTKKRKKVFVVRGKRKKKGGLII